MKKPFYVTLLFFVLAITVSSCGSSYKKRKSCRGNGSWYGNRNLGSIEQNINHQDIYKLSASANQ